MHHSVLMGELCINKLSIVLVILIPNVRRMIHVSINYSQSYTGTTGVVSNDANMSVVIRCVLSRSVIIVKY